MALERAQDLASRQELAMAPRLGLGWGLALAKNCLGVHRSTETGTQEDQED